MSHTEAGPRHPSYDAHFATALGQGGEAQGQVNYYVQVCGRLEFKWVQREGLIGQLLRAGGWAPGVGLRSAGRVHPHRR